MRPIPDRSNRPHLQEQVDKWDTDNCQTGQGSSNSVQGFPPGDTDIPPRDDAILRDGCLAGVLRRNLARSKPCLIQQELFNLLTANELPHHVPGNIAFSRSGYPMVSFRSFVMRHISI